MGPRLREGDGICAANSGRTYPHANACVCLRRFCFYRTASGAGNAGTSTGAFTSAGIASLRRSA